MNTSLEDLKTAADVKKAFACHGTLTRYGAYLIATCACWNYDTHRLDYTAALFDILTDTGKTATTTVMIAAQADETFLDAGHGIEWALGMIHARYTPPAPLCGLPPTQGWQPASLTGVFTGSPSADHQLCVSLYPPRHLVLEVSKKSLQAHGKRTG